MPAVTTKTTTPATTQTTVHINNKSLVRRYLFSYFPVTRTSPPFRSRRRLGVVVFTHSHCPLTFCVYVRRIMQRIKHKPRSHTIKQLHNTNFPLCSMVFFFSFCCIFIFISFYLFKTNALASSTSRKCNLLFLNTTAPYYLSCI